jgi:hypothetical protein
MDNISYLKPSLQKRQKRRDKRLDEELIECYRRGSRTKQMKGYKNKLKRNLYEYARQHESMKFMHGGGTKFFNDNLEPMKRFLNRKVGKNWNKVHSELCGVLSKQTISGLHVFNHLYQFVFEKVKIEGKKIYFMGNFGKYKELRSEEKWPRFYINPKTEQLMKAKLITNKEMRARWQS